MTFIKLHNKSKYRINSKIFEKLKLDNVISEFKLRAGYGEAGIQPGAFQRFPVLSAVNLGANSVFVSPITTPNKNLSVELSKETEYGADLGLNLLGLKYFKKKKEKKRS